MKNVTADGGRWYERLPAALNASIVFRFLLSLAIATFLWGWVTQLTDPIITRVYREMDIAVESLEDSMIMVTTLPTTQVRVQGPESEFSHLNRADISVYLDTSTVNGPGNTDFRSSSVHQTHPQSSRSSRRTSTSRSMSSSPR